MQLDAKIPAGPLTDKWDRHRFELKLVNPANKRKFEIIVVGTGLAGASASASLSELGYRVKTFCIQDSPRRAHSIAAQGGINAAKNYTNEGDSVWRLFFDTVKGGDFRAREANVYRLAQLSNEIIDHCVAQGIPFARDYGGLLANRSFGGAQVCRTFYARGQTGQQLLLGAYSALMRQVAAGGVTVFPRRELLDLVVVNGQARGIVVRNLINGELEQHAAHQRERMADGKHRDVDDHVLEAIEVENDADQEEDMVVSRHHMLGAEIEERPERRTVHAGNECLVALRHVMGGRAGRRQQGKPERGQQPRSQATQGCHAPLAAFDALALSAGISPAAGG